jgi:hypothetical protein
MFYFNNMRSISILSAAKEEAAYHAQWSVQMVSLISYVILSQSRLFMLRHPVHFILTRDVAFLISQSVMASI